MIKIDDEYYIDTEEHCYTLLKKGIIKSERSNKIGQEKYELVGYYSTMESLFDGYVRERVREGIRNTENAELSALTTQINELHKYLKKQFGRI